MGILFFFLLTIVFSFAEEYPKHVKETLKKITDRVYGVFGVYEQVSYKNRGFISNAYFYVADDGVIVIDALSSYKLGKEIIETIKAITDKPIRFLVITHYHTDHFYGIKAFREVGAEIIAHEYAFEYLSNPSSYNFFLARKKLLKEHLDKTQLLPPTIALTGEINLYLKVGEEYRRFEVKHLCRAHTHGDIVVFIPEEKILFSGDIVFDGRLPFLGSGNSKSWITCLEEILKMEPKILLPGHGEALTDPLKIKEAVKWTKKYITDLRNIIRRMIEEGCDVECVRERINEEMLKIDPSYAQVPVFFNVNPVNAYYVYFEIENEMLMEE
ncbi:MAG: MBL fold metallo-hydrolase [Aquifex sp.]|nr:MAG: MBL fold metallo-hydrolase [Aquifex sp.]